MGRKVKGFAVVLSLALMALLLHVFASNSSLAGSAMGLTNTGETEGASSQGKEDNQTDINEQTKEEDAAETSPPLPPPSMTGEDSATKVAYVTFDDGPSASTDRLLDILAEHDVPATFFMLQPNMYQYPESVWRLVHDGHAPALHGYSHNKQAFYQSAASVLSEMNGAQGAVLEITGQKTTLIRPPFGSHPHMKPEYKEAVKEAGYQVWDWNVDSRDWYYRDHRLVTNTIAQIDRLAEKNIDPVILLHDRPDTVEFIPEIINYLTNNGYELRPLDPTLEPVVLGE